MDIILVHGLGGTSRKTWSRNRDAALFWPQEWLPYEPGFQKTRILSFGYNAHFAAAGRENILNIADFAKELLFGMKFALNERAEELHIGKVCPFRDDKGSPRRVKAQKTVHFVGRSSLAAFCRNFLLPLGIPCVFAPA